LGLATAGLLEKNRKEYRIRRLPTPGKALRDSALSLGAAYLAGLTVGVYQNTDELTDLWRSERRFLPTLDRPRAQELMERWEHAVRQTVL